MSESYEWVFENNRDLCEWVEIKYEGEGSGFNVGCGGFFSEFHPLEHGSQFCRYCHKPLVIKGA